MLTFDSTDTLALSIAPRNESPATRVARLEREAKACQVNNQIDAEIKATKIALRKRKKPVKVLVLGQSESGKTTTIKNFQMVYAQQAWRQERASWRAVIYLNLVRSVNMILDFLVAEFETASSPRASQILSPYLTDQHHILLLRLGPLRQIQKDLESLLGSGSYELSDGYRGPSVGAFPTLQDLDDDDVLACEHHGHRVREFSILSNCGWKSALHSVDKKGPTEAARRTQSPGKRHTLHPIDEIAELIATFKEDIKAVWSDHAIQDLLTVNNIRLEHSPGFFLNDMDRITSFDYEPSDEDVVRARLRTLGVQEYTFRLDQGNDSTIEWVMYDVAGCRTQRAAWVPYFTDITALIFLAPLSCFDERLAEDRRINRLEDTFLLWKTICSSKLLSHVQVILFMNKCDLLAKKLRKQQVKVRDYVPEFKDRENNFKTVSNWFHRAFIATFKENSPAERYLYAHFTSVVDTTATRHTLTGVQEAVLRNHFIGIGLV